MTVPSPDPFETLRIPVEPLAPRPAFALDLRARLHRRLGAAPPPGLTAMAKAAGLEYEVVGNPHGEPVLLLHAAGATSFVPLLSQPALTDRYRLIRCHRRGHGGSDPAPGRVTVAGHARDARALLDHLGIERAHVVGHSGSGAIALQLALDAPGAVRSLVLEEPAIQAIDPQWNAASWDVVAPLVELHRAGESARAMDLWMRGISPSWRQQLARTVPGGPQQTIEDAAAFFADADAVAEWAFDHDGVSRLTVPVLYILADGSSPAMAAIMHRFRDLVPHVESVLIPETSHMLHTDQPGLIADAIRAFLDHHAT